MKFIIFYIGGAVVDNLVGAILRERQKKVVGVAVVVAPSFTEGARRAAKAAPIPVILTNEDNVADAVLNYRRRSGSLCSQCRVRDVDSCSFYQNAFWVGVGVSGTVVVQNIVRYFH